MSCYKPVTVAGSSSYQRLLSTSSVTSEKDDAEKQNTKVASQHSRDSATVHKPSSISSALVGIGTGKIDLTGASKWKGVEMLIAFKQISFNLSNVSLFLLADDLIN